MQKENHKNIVILGAGNVAFHLGTALKRAGNNILQIYSRTSEQALALSKTLEATATNQPEDINQDADIYLVALKDDIIETIANQLKLPDGKIIAHTSGTISMSVLASCSANYGVFYPLQTFSRNKEVDFNEIPLCIEASNETTEQLLMDLAGELSSKVYRIDSENRKMLHLAAVFACNFTNHLYSIAENILQQSGLPFELLLPLINETTNKVRTHSPLSVQTGPAQRGDQKIIAEHIELLKANKDHQDVYRLMSELIAKER